MVRAYTAGAMTGLSGAELVERSQDAAIILLEAGIEPLDPVLSEGINPKNPLVQATHEQMVEFWKRDKQMIRDAHVLIDLTPERKSEGVSHEIGYARYYLYRPIVRVYPKGQLPNKASVACFEDDVIVDSLEEAAKVIKERWGNFSKRFIWRLSLYNRCLLGMVRCWFEGWK